jgi:hypothetical protein
VRSEKKAYPICCCERANPLTNLEIGCIEENRSEVRARVITFDLEASQICDDSHHAFRDLTLREYPLSLVYKLQEKKADSTEREENFGALQLRVDFSSCCLRVVGHGGKAERAGKLSWPALLHPFCILDDNRAFFLSLSLSLSLSL